MKNTLIILTLILSSVCFGQNLKATYIKSFANLKTENNTYEDASDIKPIQHIYSYSKNKSFYKMLDVEAEKIDSIKSKDRDGYIQQITISASKDDIYKDLQKKILYRNYTIYQTEFNIIDNLTNFDWELVDEFQEIKGFKCKKAITNKEKFPITAWYCEGISINDGPDRFYGLPGLILKVELGVFSTITIDQIKITDDKVNVEEPVIKTSYLTTKEFNEKLNKLMLDKANEE